MYLFKIIMKNNIQNLLDKYFDEQSSSQEETELRLLKALGFSLLILLLCFALAITAKIPFPFVLFGGIACAAIVFLKIFRAPPKPLPSI